MSVIIIRREDPDLSDGSTRYKNVRFCYLVTTTIDVIGEHCTTDISTVLLDENETIPKDKAKINGTEVTFCNYFPTLSAARPFMMTI